MFVRILFVVCFWALACFLLPQILFLPSLWVLDYFLLSWILFVVCFWVLACFFPAQILFLPSLWVLACFFSAQILFLLCFWVLDYFFLPQIPFLLYSYYLHLVYFLFMNCFTTLDSYDTLSLSIRNSKLSKFHFYLQFLENLMLRKINIGRRFSTKKPGNNLTLMDSS